MPEFSSHFSAHFSTHVARTSFAIAWGLSFVASSVVCAQSLPDSEQVLLSDSASAAAGAAPTPDEKAAVDIQAEPVERLKVIVPAFRAARGDVSAGELDTITGLVVYQLGKVVRFDVVTAAEIREMLALEAEKAAVGCSEDDSCVNEIADALGADLILTGQVGRLGPRYIIQLSLIETASAAIVARAQIQVSNLAEVGASVTNAVHEITELYGGLPNIDEARRAQAEADARTSYAARFVSFATEPDTVMLFAMLAGGLIALVPPIFWAAPIVQGAILWFLGGDIAGRKYPRWWLAIPAGWATYAAAFVIFAGANGLGFISTQFGGVYGPGTGIALSMSGTGVAVVIMFMVEPVVAWWAGTLGAEDLKLFNDVEEAVEAKHPEAGPTSDDEGREREEARLPALDFAQRWVHAAQP